MYCIVFVNGSHYNKGKVTELYSKEFSPSVAKEKSRYGVSLGVQLGSHGPVIGREVSGLITDEGGTSSPGLGRLIWLMGEGT